MQSTGPKTDSCHTCMKREGKPRMEEFARGLKKERLSHDFQPKPDIHGDLCHRIRMRFRYIFRINM